MRSRFLPCVVPVLVAGCFSASSGRAPGAADFGADAGGVDATLTDSSAVDDAASTVDAPAVEGAVADASEAASTAPEASTDAAIPSDGGPSADGGAPEGGGVTTACSTCMAASCTAGYGTCEADPDCVAVLACTSGCGPLATGCQDDCTTGHTTGISEALLLSDCAGRSCATSCPWGAALPQCNECFLGKVPADSDACYEDAACLSWLICALQCGMDFTCYQSCPTADGPANVMLNDLQTTCSAECQVL